MSVSLRGVKSFTLYCVLCLDPFSLFERINCCCFFSESVPIHLNIRNNYDTVVLAAKVLYNALHSQLLFVQHTA